MKKIISLNFLAYAKIICAFYSIFFLSSCSSILTARKVKEPIITEYLSGNIVNAEKIACDYSESRTGTGDELMWRLEEAKIKFDQGKYKEALSTFEIAEKIVMDFDERAKISAREVGAEAGAAITNQNAIPYRGFISDRILINAYKALCYLGLGKKNDAMVEIRRMHQRQKDALEYFDSEIKRAEEEIKNQRKELSEAAQKNSANFDSIINSNPELKKSADEMKKLSKKIYGDFINPFSLYLSAIVYLMNGNYNEANVDFRNLYKAMPDNNIIAKDFVTTSKQIGARIPEELQTISEWKYPLNKNIVFVIFENGMIAALKEEKVQIILPPPIPTGYSGIAFPVLETFPEPFQSINIEAENKIYQPVTISKMDSVFGAEFNVLFPYIITRLVISTIVKEAAAFAAQMAAEEAGGDLAKLGTVVGTSLYKYIFNTADTRSWQTLPKKYMITHFPKPEEGILKISWGANSKTITLKPTTTFAIIYIRAQSANFFNIQTLEF